MTSFAKIASVTCVAAALSGCSLASLAGIDTSDTGSIDPKAIRPATTMDLMARWYPNMTLDQIRAQIAADMLADGATQAEIDEKLAALANVTETTPGVWYDANGNVLGPVYWNPVTGTIVPVSEDGDPSNDAGLAYNPQGVVPNCLSKPGGCGSQPDPDDGNSGGTDPKAIRPATVADMMAHSYPGMTLDQIRAQIRAEMIANGASPAEADAAMAQFANITASTPGVWYDANGNEVGVAYWNPVTGSIVPVSQDGDPANDAGVAYNPQGIVPDCLDETGGCGGGNVTDPVVSLADPVLQAKQSATYVGGGTVAITNAQDNSVIGTWGTNTEIQADFTAGTVSGQSAWTDEDKDTYAIVLHETAINGLGFSGGSHLNDMQVGTTTTNGHYSGSFAADGSTVSGTASGTASGTDVNDPWSANYNLTFSGSEQK